MAEAEATIAENPEPQDAPEEQAPAAAPPESSTQPDEPPPKRGRGRPAGAKDKAPRSTKPKVRAEPIPQPKAKAEATQRVGGIQPPTPTMEEERVGISQTPIGPLVLSLLPLALSFARLLLTCSTSGT